MKSATASEATAALVTWAAWSQRPRRIVGDGVLGLSVIFVLVDCEVTVKSASLSLKPLLSFDAVYLSSAAALPVVNRLTGDHHTVLPHVGGNLHLSPLAWSESPLVRRCTTSGNSWSGLTLPQFSTILPPARRTIP